MRIIVLFGILVVTGLLPSRPSLAYAEGPWCLIYGEGRERCDFPTFEMCRREAQLRGSTSFCNLNPSYPGNWSRQPKTTSKSGG
jgi:hypothetical protein